MSEYWTMKQIGEVFGISSHVVGRKLKALGYRTPSGKPSSEAFGAGLVQQKFTDDYANYLWAWDKDRTVRLLEESGMKKLEDVKKM
jgi:hypothetical protein